MEAVAVARRSVGRDVGLRIGLTDLRRRRRRRRERQWGDSGRSASRVVVGWRWQDGDRVARRAVQDQRSRTCRRHHDVGLVACSCDARRQGTVEGEPGLGWIGGIVIGRPNQMLNVSPTSNVPQAYAVAPPDEVMPFHAPALISLQVGFPAFAALPKPISAASAAAMMPALRIKCVRRCRSGEHTPPRRRAVGPARRTAPISHESPLPPVSSCQPTPPWDSQKRIAAPQP